MKKSITLSVATAAGLTLLASTPAWASLPGTTPAADVVPALATPQASTDLPPEHVDLEALGGIDPSSVRSLGSDELASYWLGEASNGDVCLISYIPGGNEVASSSCVSLPVFHQSGLAMLTGEDVNDTSRSTEVYYLPEGVDVSQIGASDVADASARSGGPTNLASGRPGTLDVHPADVQRDDGTTFRFTPLTTPEK